ncbi:MAG TPA: hypothetical protein VNA15_07890 [Candidatus Angelobacter sp.]|nr:hypothetical protein [Candidatus Angelobacter sp.]
MVLAYLIVTLYLWIASSISFALDINVPYGGLASSTLLVMEAVGFLGLGSMLSITNPVKKL